MAATVENRKDKRFHVRDLEVFIRESDERLGDVNNLSRSGMLITHDAEIAVDTVRELRIPLGHVISGLADFEPDVRVRWFRQNDISGLFGSGFEFLDNTKEQWGLIQVMIDVFAVSRV
jgi:hypothetical protein